MNHTKYSSYGFTADYLAMAFENKTTAAWQRLKHALAVTKLSATAGLFLVTTLDFCSLSDRFFVRHLRRMQRHFNAVTLFQFLDDSFDVQLA